MLMECHPLHCLTTPLWVEINSLDAVTATVFGLGFSFFDVLFFLSFFFLTGLNFLLALFVRFCRNNSLILLRAIKTCRVTADFFFFFF